MNKSNGAFRGRIKEKGTLDLLRMFMGSSWHTKRTTVQQVNRNSLTIDENGIRENHDRLSPFRTLDIPIRLHRRMEDGEKALD